MRLADLQSKGGLRNHSELDFGRRKPHLLSEIFYKLSESIGRLFFTSHFAKGAGGNMIMVNVIYHE